MTVDATAELYSSSLRRLLGPIARHLDDQSVSEVMINGFDEVFIERGGRIFKTEDSFRDEDSLQAALRNIAQFVGKRLTPENLSIEARLPDGSRVHIVQAPAARKGSSVAIRKFSKEKLDIQSLIDFGSLTEECASFLGVVVGLAKNVIISGGTGSGKTTLLNCLSAMIPDGERIIVLEDSSELQLQQEHVVPFEAKPADPYGRGGITIRELFRASLRMRPDRIVVGECRGGEAIDMIQAMNSGHGGSMSTAHANTPLDALSRLEVMCLMGDIDIPMAPLRVQICAAIDVIVQISRLHDGSRKITHVSEVNRVGDDGKNTVNDIFLVNDSHLQWTGNKPSFNGEVWGSEYEHLAVGSEQIWR
jgi:pilus assembly protein CpaF